MKKASHFIFAFCCLVSAAFGARLPGGTYTCSVDFGDVLLTGRYPFEVDGIPGGSMELQTSPGGVVTGTVFVFGEQEEAVGSIRVRDKQIRLVLRGKVDEGRINVNAVLAGSAFVGTARLKGRTSLCRLSVPGIAPIRAVYALALRSPTDGLIAGTGMLQVEQLRIPVKARGRIAQGKVALTIRGGKTTLRTSNGRFTSVGFTSARWIAQGFGALRRGQDLKTNLVR